MAAVSEAQRRSPFDNNRLATRDLPLLSTSPASTPVRAPSPDRMDISPSAATSKGAQRLPNGSPDQDRLAPTTSAGSFDKDNAASATAPAPAPAQPISAAAAAAAAQQPKVVQAAFIHKLYNMLEDQTIQHLISWSTTNESFVMSPSTEFSKVLASYFKHTNISSFVRQLNMYGFHKVSDVFHAGSPDSPLWEFKHGAGSFKRGDLVGLREIKRRASRQTLIHRDSFSGVPKMQAIPHQPPPPPPQEVPVPQDTSVESRLGMLEYNLHDVYARLSRADDTVQLLNAKCGIANEALTRVFHITSELASHLIGLVPDPEHPVRKEVAALRTEISRQTEAFRSAEPTIRPTLTIGSAFDPMPPISPRHHYDSSRRPSLQVTGPLNTFRAPPAPVSASPRRQGSLSIPDGGHSPSAGRVQQHHGHGLPPPSVPQQPHPLATVSSSPGSLSRRHTTADIRHHGWQAAPLQGAAASPYASGQNSTQWPSSPYRGPVAGGDQHIRDSLASYELPKPASAAPHAHGAPLQQRHTTPPPEHAAQSYANTSNEAGWQLPGPKFPFRHVDFSAPPTRRSSMASNVHSLLNPAETAEREGEDEPPEERKRKRMI